MRLPGSWTIARPFGVPVRLHWSIPVCAVLAGGFRVAPGAYLAYLILVLLHESGHAWVVRRVGGKALALDVTGFGGLCWWEGSVSPIGRACIAWGGIWAQMIVLAVTVLAVAIFGPPKGEIAGQMVTVAISSNLWLIGLNLLPIPPLDGKDAWTLFPLLRRRFARRSAELPAARIKIVRAPIPARPSRPVVIDPTPADDGAEDIYTPEALAVIERARVIARETARSPTEAGKVGGQGGGEPGST